MDYHEDSLEAIKSTHSEQAATTYCWASSEPIAWETPPYFKLWTARHWALLSTAGSLKHWDTGFVNTVLLCKDTLSTLQNLIETEEEDQGWHTSDTWRSWLARSSRGRRTGMDGFQMWSGGMALVFPIKQVSKVQQHKREFWSRKSVTIIFSSLLQTVWSFL